MAASRAIEGKLLRGTCRFTLSSECVMVEVRQRRTNSLPGSERLSLAIRLHQRCRRLRSILGCHCARVEGVSCLANSRCNIRSAKGDRGTYTVGASSAAADQCRVTDTFAG